MRALGLAPALVLLSLLTACDGTSAAPQASSSPTPPASSGTAIAIATPTASGAATLVAVCDNAQDAFRSGTLPERQQYKAMYNELQGMIDVADRAGARVLRPIQRVAEAIGYGPAREANRQRFNRAFRTLETTCKAAGSIAWTG